MYSEEYKRRKTAEEYKPEMGLLYFLSLAKQNTVSGKNLWKNVIVPWMLLILPLELC